MGSSRVHLEKNPLWFKDAIIYQLHVKAFCDSNGDGIGDFKGLTQKLDYLKNLGITAIWLLPFYPSPLKDDGYDIANYYDIHPSYGTLRDFKEFLKQAHIRGLRVITELVINHTSDQHPWFLRAKKAKPGSSHRNYYVWSENPEKYKDARIIFKDFEQSNWAWDEETKSYYWHRFYSHQPDLNFDNPNVQKDLFRALDFWFEMGVDGLRLDAVPYLFEREGTNCENLPETYAFLKKLRKHVDQKFKNRMLLAEANQWPEDAVKYFGKGDACHMAFHFPLMPRMYMSIQMEDRFPIIDILEQTPAIPSSCQWAIFLRNHDELTLEMVTDEERDYMYRTYAKDARSKINLGIRRRLMPLLSNNQRKIELMNILLLSLPGTPIIYYGDEIGMGDNHFLGDRDGVRTPMQWSPDRNAGFSKANPQKLYLPVIIDSEYHYETVNVETQESNLSSPLWWMKRVIAVRKNYKAFSQGELKVLLPENPKVLTFIRKYKDEIILVVINLSRFAQVVEIDLKEYAGYTPQEIFSQNEFPVIKDIPYVITMGYHNQFWLHLKKKASHHKGFLSKALKINLNKSWEEILSNKYISKFEDSILIPYVTKCRWFPGKSRIIHGLVIDETIDIEITKGHSVKALILKVQYSSGSPERYLLPITFKYIKEETMIAREHPEGIICRLSVNGDEGYIFDAAYDESFQKKLLDIIANKKKIKSRQGFLIGLKGKNFTSICGKKGVPDSSHIFKAEQSNTSIVYDNRLFLKIFRRIEDGINPDAELTRYLSENRKWPQVPVFAGAIEYRTPDAEPIVISLMQSCVANQTDAWSYTLDQVKIFYDQILAKQKERTDELELDPSKQKALAFDLNAKKILIDGFYLEMLKALGKRVGEMHLNLSSDYDDDDFRPEPFSTLYQRSVYQAMGSQARRVLQLLKKNIEKLPLDVQGEAVPIIESEKEIYLRLKMILDNKFSAKKIRIHGDLHLGQALFTGKDFVIFDFEGEPSKPLSERRIKRSALRDIAGMLRSFHYAAYSTLLLNKSVRNEDISILEYAADCWYKLVSDVFLKSYFDTIGNAEFLPKAQKELNLLMQIYLLDKAIYELGYELNNRPDWLVIPLRGIRDILEHFSLKSVKG